MIIISVGTSLLNNLLSPLCEINRIFEGRKDYKDVIQRLVLNFSRKNETTNINTINALFKNGLDGGAGKPFSFFKDYVTYFSQNNTILENIKKRTGNNPDLLPAEISSLFLYYYDVEGKEKSELKIQNDEDKKNNIVLLCTETADSVLCALIIKNIIEKSAYFKNKCQVLGIKNDDPFNHENGIVVIKNLDMVNKADQWISWKEDNLKPDCGLNNLLSYIEKKKNQIKLLIRSGSYKELSSDLLLISAQYCLPSYYLFENSTTAILNIPQNQQDHLVDNLFQKLHTEY